MAYLTENWWKVGLTKVTLSTRIYQNRPLRCLCRICPWKVIDKTLVSGKAIILWWNIGKKRLAWNRRRRLYVGKTLLFLITLYFHDSCAHCI